MHALYSKALSSPQGIVGAPGPVGPQGKTVLVVFVVTLVPLDPLESRAWLAPLVLLEIRDLPERVALL